MTECPNCGKDYERLGTHWSYNDSHRPSFTEEQHEILTGLLMGDGTIYKKSPDHAPNFRVSLIVPEYLEWFDEKFGCLSTGVRLKSTAKESCENCKISDNDDISDYNDVYRAKTRNHPELEQYQNWYSTGEKIFPDVELTPTILTHWYISDGNWNNNRIRIGMSNEINHRGRIEQMFDMIGCSISRWDISERKDSSMRCCAVFNKRTAEKMFDYMDSAPPGFEYKFPEQPEASRVDFGQ